MRLKRRNHKSKYGVMICTPIPRDSRINVFASHYCEAESRIPWIGWIHEPGYAPEYARNIMVQRVKDNHKDVTHILTHDADVVPPPDTILRLLKHNKDIIAGVYPIFMEDRKCWSFSTEEDFRHILFPYKKLSKKPFKVTALAGSTVLIKLDVFRKIEKPWYETIRDENGRKLMGEDFHFSISACVDGGYDLWVDPTVVCHHENTKDLLAIFNSE